MRRVFTNYSFLEPPHECIDVLFPFIEEEEEALWQHWKSLGRVADDYALAQFLILLRFFRTVLIQDAAVLYSKYPESGTFRHAPFNTALFKDFAMSSTLQIQAAEEAARHLFENLPEHLVASLRGIVTTTNLEQQREREERQLQYKEISAQNQALINLVVELYNNQPRKRGKGSSKSESFHSFNLPSMRLIVNIVQSPLTLSSTETPSRLSMTIQPRLLTTSDGSDNRGTSVTAFGSTGTSPNITTDVDENLPGESIVPGSSPLSSSSQLSDMQLKAMEELKMKYGPERVQKA